MCKSSAHRVPIDFNPRAHDSAISRVIARVEGNPDARRSTILVAAWIFHHDPIGRAEDTQPVVLLSRLLSVTERSALLPLDLRFNETDAEIGRPR